MCDYMWTMDLEWQLQPSQEAPEGQVRQVRTKGARCPLEDRAKGVGTTHPTAVATAPVATASWESWVSQAW